MGKGGPGTIRRWVSLGGVGFALAIADLVPGAAVAQQPEAVSLTDTLPRAELTRMIETGADLFNGGTCTTCHAVGGRGDGRRAPDLTDSEWLHSDGSWEGILMTILWGVRKEDMKAVTPRPFPMNPDGGMTLSRQERRDVAAYVWSLGRDGAPPTVAAQNDFLDLLERGDIEEALSLFEREWQSANGEPLFGEAAINRLGYMFLQQRSQPRTAIEVFELNTELHPESWNVWDSLAEGHMVAGDRERAIELYEKSLDLNPDNDNAREKLAELRQG